MALEKSFVGVDRSARSGQVDDGGGGGGDGGGERCSWVRSEWLLMGPQSLRKSRDDGIRRRVFFSAG